MPPSPEAPPSSCPPVSVIIPLFNVVPYLDATIASLRAQQWPNLEIIAVDDGSTDGSAELFQSLCPEARLVRQANAGPSAARNAALALATAPYVAFLDGDDLWPPGKLARQVARLEDDPTLMATMGFITYFMDVDAGREWGRSLFLFLLGGMVARRHLFTASPGLVGNFDERNHPFFGEDTNWFLRAWESGQEMEIRSETEIYYRRRAGSLTADPEDSKRSFHGLILGSLRRRRGPNGEVRRFPDCIRLPAGLASPYSRR